MKRKLLLCMGAMLLAGTLAAQVPVPEWETGVEQIKKSDKDRSRTGICNCRGVIERKKQEERITHHLHSPRLSECRQAAGGGELSENGSESG